MLFLSWQILVEEREAMISRHEEDLRQLVLEKETLTSYVMVTFFFIFNEIFLEFISYLLRRTLNSKYNKKRIEVLSIERYIHTWLIMQLTDFGMIW